MEHYNVMDLESEPNSINEECNAKASELNQ